MKLNRIWMKFRPGKMTETALPNAGIQAPAKTPAVSSRAIALIPSPRNSGRRRGGDDMSLFNREWESGRMVRGDTTD